MRPLLIMHGERDRMDRIGDLWRGLGGEVERVGYAESTYQRGDCVHLTWASPGTMAKNLWRRTLVNSYFMENGWLTPDDGCCIDAHGLNAMSSIVGAAITCEPQADCWNRIAAIHASKRLDDLPDEFSGVKRGEYIFLPLQVESDSQVMFAANVPEKMGLRQAWLVDLVCRSFPDRQIVIRPHPFDLKTMERIGEYSSAMRGHANVQVHPPKRGLNNSYQYCAHARAVIGVNSTVLTEALTFGKPVAAFGRGVFTENDVVLEMDRDSNPRKVVEFVPDRLALTRYFTLLFARQVPYDCAVDDVSRYPVLQGMWDHAVNLANSKPPIAEGLEVYGFWESRMPEPSLDGLEVDGVFVAGRYSTGVEPFDSHKRPPIPGFKRTIPFTWGIQDTAWRDPILTELARDYPEVVFCGTNKTRPEFYKADDAGMRTFERMLVQVRRYGVRKWWVPVTPLWMLEDMNRPNGRQYRDLIREHNLPVVCFCGQILCGYLFGDWRIPDQGYHPGGGRITELSGQNLRKLYGLTLDRLRAYLNGMHVVTGVGGQTGLDAGMAWYAKQCGYKGVLSYLPFEFTWGDALEDEWTDVCICGVTGYRNEPEGIVV